MIEYAAKITGDQRVALRFDRFPDEAHAALRARIAEITADTAGEVDALIPRGKTNRLAAQLHFGVDDSERRIRGWISLAGGSAALVKQAATLEYGNRREAFRVKAYRRTLDQVFGHITAPFQQAVEAYQRTGTIQAGDFLRGPLRAHASSALEQMNAAVDEAARKGNDA